MNYKIIGSDQKEYGPVSLEQLRQWVTEGRVNAQTMIQPEGGTDWKPLSAFPELLPLAVSAPSPLPSAPALEGKPPEARVRVPAILLIIAGGLGVLGGLFNVAQNLFGLAPWTNNLPPNLPPEVANMFKMIQTMGLPLAIVGLLISGFLLFGGISMLKLQRWGLAFAASIIALLCGNPCCCPIGLVAGIWALIVLPKPEVKSAFH